MFGQRVVDVAKIATQRSCFSAEIAMLTDNMTLDPKQYLYVPVRPVADETTQWNFTYQREPFIQEEEFTLEILVQVFSAIWRYMSRPPGMFSEPTHPFSAPIDWELHESRIIGGDIVVGNGSVTELPHTPISSDLG